MLEDGKPKYCILINDFNFQYKLHINYLRNVLLACSKRVIFSKKCKFQFLKSLLDDSFIFQHIYQQVLISLVLQRNQENVPVVCIDMIAL